MSTNAIQPRDRSVELNADVMNAWMKILQDWSDELWKLSTNGQLEVLISPSAKNQYSSVNEVARKSSAMSNCWYVST